MIASHRFPMFRPKEKIIDLDFALYFFKSKWGKKLLEIGSPGGAGRNKTLSQKNSMSYPYASHRSLNNSASRLS